MTLTSSAATPIDRVLERLSDRGYGPKGNGNQWTARCPAHDDTNPSLSIGLGHDGKALLTCHAGCELDHIAAALELQITDLFPPKPKHNERPTIVARYPYTSETGQLLYEVVRYSDKSFRQRRPDGQGGWIWSIKDVRRVLYRLPAVLEAVAGGHLVWITEGEKDADALQAALPAGEVATTNSGGAGKWRAEHTSALAGASVIVWADADAKGLQHATQVAQALEGVAATVSIVKSKHGKDAAEHLGRGHTLDDLDTIDPTKADQESDRAATKPNRFRDQLLRGLDITRLPPLDPLIDGFLDRDSLALIYGRPKSGKTFVMLDLALSVATGTWWHGQRTTAGPVLYVMAEGARGAASRLQAWMTHHGLHSDPQQLIVAPLAVNLLDYADTADLIDVAAETQPVLVIIDTLNRCMPGTDEGSADMGRAISAMDRIRQATGACIAAVHHSGKDATRGARGHSSLLGAVDTELEVLNAGDGIVTLRTTAQRNMVEANPRRFTLRPLADSLVIADYTGRLSDTDAVTSHGRICLEVLDRIATDAGISTTVWRDAVQEEGISRSSFYAQVKTLQELGETTNIGTQSRPLWIRKPRS